MRAFSEIMAEVRNDQVLPIAFGLLVTLLLVQAFAPLERRRLRVIMVFFLLQLVLVLTAGALRAEASPIHPYVRLASLILATLCVVGISSLLLFDVLLPPLRCQVPRILRDLVSAGTIIVATFVIASRLGFNLSGIIATSAVVTAVIGFSLQDTLGNVMGGLALQLDNSISVGDWIKVEGQGGQINGRVAEIRWRYTAVETRNWETVIVPNSVLMKGQVLVLGRRSGRPALWRRWVWFNVDFRHPPSDVIALVEKAICAGPIEHVAADPAPQCIFTDFTDSYARYAVRYWLTDFSVDDPTDSVVRTRIYYALKRAGIPLSIPAQAVFLTEESSERRAGKVEEERERRLKALASVDLFAHLPEADRIELADSLHFAPFSRDEIVTRQGAEAHWLYMILDGEVSVRVAVEGAPEREVARLDGGSFVGEMSLMTGAPRSATVVALCPLTCYRLDKSAFQAIVRRRPDLAEEVASVLAKREVELAAVKENLDEEAKHLRMASARTDLLHSIRSFFALNGD